MTKVAEGITADIPDAMVDNQARQFVENFKMQITQQGIPYDQYAKMTGVSEEKLLEDAKEPALRQVRMDLALAAIIKAENIEATDEDVEDEFKKLAEQYGMDLEMVKKYVQADQVKDQVVSRKAVAVVVDSAAAVKPEKKKKSAKKAEEPAEETAGGEEKPKKTAKRTAKKAAGEEKDTKKASDGEEKPAKKTARKAAKETKKEED